MSRQNLTNAAMAARNNSYAPYSHIAVGAALLTGSGRVYLGCNIENAAYSPTVCAERVAFFSAIAAGEREFIRIAVAGAPVGEPVCAPFPPCGVCRQVMAEHCAQDFEILLATEAGYEVRTLADLLPFGFQKECLTPTAGEKENSRANV